MGLDMYAYCTEATLTDIDFATPDDAHAIATWRKHPNLHGWMERLYRTKGGTQCFNCVNLKLEPEDFDALEAEVMADTLPQTIGFFFGESLPEDKELDLAFMAEARERFENGDSIFYSSWW